MRIYIALSTIVIIFCQMDRDDDTPETLRTADKSRPEWQEWLRASLLIGGTIVGAAFFMAWLNPTP